MTGRINGRSSNLKEKPKIAKQAFLLKGPKWFSSVMRSISQDPCMLIIRKPQWMKRARSQSQMETG
jgi:hypothetical protein